MASRLPLRREYRNLSQAGVGIAEVLILISIIAVVCAVATIQVKERVQEGYQNTARTQINNLKAILEEYRRACSRYPTTEQGLAALEGGACPAFKGAAILKDGKIPLDPWNRAYQYSSADGGKSFLITSYGRDGREGGERNTPDMDLHSSD